MTKSKTFTKDVSVELIIDGNSVEVVATIQFSTTPYDPGRISGPPEKCYPPEGGEIDGPTVVALVFPAVWKRVPHGTVVGKVRDEIKIDCPDWLAETIIENVSDDTLNEAVDFDDED